MNRLLKITLCSFLFFTIGASGAFAQHAEWLKKSPQERAAMETRKLQQELSLSTEQLNDVEKITAKKHEEIGELMMDKDENREERRKELMAIWKDWDKEMQDILEEGQEDEYAQLKMDYKEKLFAAFDRAKAHKQKMGSSNEMDSDVLDEDIEIKEEETAPQDDLEDALKETEAVDIEE